MWPLCLYVCVCVIVAVDLESIVLVCLLVSCTRKFEWITSVNWMIFLNFRNKPRSRSSR